jgi:hypothetical protein
MDSIAKVETMMAQLENLTWGSLFKGRDLGTSIMIGASTLVLYSWCKDSRSQQQTTKFSPRDPKLANAPKKMKPKGKPNNFSRKKPNDGYLRFLTDEDLGPESDNEYIQSGSETTGLDMGQIDHGSTGKITDNGQKRGELWKNKSKFRFKDNEEIDRRADDLYFAIMEELEE